MSISVIPIPMFGMFVAIGLLVAIYFAKMEVIRLEGFGILSTAKIPPKKNQPHQVVPVHRIIADLGMILALFGIIGARLFHILEYPQQFLHDPVGMIFSQGGFTIYGGLLFGIITGIIY